MGTSKLCLICLCEKRNDFLISLFTPLSDIQNELKAVRGGLCTNSPNNKINWTSIENLAIGEMLADCSPEEVCNEFPATLKSILYIHFFLQINPIEDQENRMCRDCIRDLITAYLFRMQCRKSIRQLKKQLSRQQQMDDVSDIKEVYEPEFENVFIDKGEADIKDGLHPIKTGDDGMDSSVNNELCNNVVGEQKVRQHIFLCFTLRILFYFVFFNFATGGAE